MAANLPLLRVRCVDDGRELLIEPRRQEWRVQVATVKRLVLEQRRARRLRPDGESKREDEGEGEGEDEELARCFLLFQGRIMADGDAVNLFSLGPSDFFVFVQEASDEQDERPSEHLRQPLLAMGFQAEQVECALQSGASDLDELVERLANGLDYPRTPRRADLDSRALLGVNYMPELQQLAQADPFQAIIMIKEEMAADAMRQLLENPGRTVAMLRKRPDPQYLDSGYGAVQPSVAAGSHSTTNEDTTMDTGSASVETPIDRVSKLHGVLGAGCIALRDVASLTNSSLPWDLRMTWL